MTTSDQFKQAALDSLGAFPTVAKYVQAGDPRILAQIGAMSTMLAMLSSQVDTAAAEPFLKVRDSTILADATLKGILPLGRACRVALDIQNTGTNDVVIAAGRAFLDSKGRVYEAEASTTVPAGQTRTCTFVQLTRRTITQTVQVATAFYRVAVTQTDDAVYTNSIGVRVGTQEFTYSPDWFNVNPGDFAYQAQTDEFRQLWVCFGSRGVVGYGVQPGDVISIDVTECEGQVTDLEPGSAFNMQYVYTVQDGGVRAKLNSVLDTGASPPTMDDLRVLSSYPALYDHNAVYLGEFDMLLRRYLSPVTFLSVWNEQVEETVRGANVSNINTLFVSGIVDGMTDATFQARAKDLIARADDSYRVRFVPALLTPVAVTVTGSVSVVHDAATVQNQVVQAVLSVYGQGKPAVSRGGSNPIRNKALSDLVRKQVPAFQDEMADLQITITLPSAPLPEQALYISAASLTVNITRASFNNGLWGY